MLNPLVDVSIDRLAIPTIRQQNVRHCLTACLHVATQQVEGADPLTGEVPVMLSTYGTEALNDAKKKRAGTAGGIDDGQLIKIPVGGVPDQVEDHVDDPSASVDLAIGHGLCGDRFGMDSGARRAGERHRREAIVSGGHVDREEGVIKRSCRKVRSIL